MAEETKNGGTHTDNLYNLTVDGMGIVNKDEETGKHRGGIFGEEGMAMEARGETAAQDSGGAAMESGRMTAGTTSVESGIGNEIESE